MKKLWLGIGLLLATAAYAGVIVHGQLVDASAENLSADPTSHTGRFYLNTTTHLMKYYTGSAWLTVTDTTNAVTSARLINTTAPITGGGDLSADRTIAVSAIGQTTAGVDSGIQTRVGTNTNDTPTTTLVGEIMEISRVRSSAASLTSPNTSNVGSTTSFTLTAGDWDVRAFVGFQPATTTSVTILDAAVSATSATLPTAPALGVPTSGEMWVEQSYAAMVPGNGDDLAITLPTFQVKVANGATKQLFLVADATFSVSTLKVYGWMQARRMR